MVLCKTTVSKYHHYVFLRYLICSIVFLKFSGRSPYFVIPVIFDEGAAVLVVVKGVVVVGVPKVD